MTSPKLTLEHFKKLCDEHRGPKFWQDHGRNMVEQMDENRYAAAIYCAETRQNPQDAQTIYSGTAEYACQIPDNPDNYKNLMDLAERITKFDQKIIVWEIAISHAPTCAHCFKIYKKLPTNPERDSLELDELKDLILSGSFAKESPGPFDMSDIQFLVRIYEEEARYSNLVPDVLNRAILSLPIPQMQTCWEILPLELKKKLAPETLMEVDECLQLLPKPPSSPSP